MASGTLTISDYLDQYPFLHFYYIQSTFILNLHLKWKKTLISALGRSRRFPLRSSDGRTNPTGKEPDIRANVDHIEPLLNSFPRILIRSRINPGFLSCLVRRIEDLLDRFCDDGVFDSMGKRMSKRIG